MSRMAESARQAGAVGIRANGIDDIAAIRAQLQVPIIGLWKDGEKGVYITPTVEHAIAVARAGADIVALDGTDRPRPDGRSLTEVIAAVHEMTGCPVLADVATLADGKLAAEAGADAISTTLSGYTATSPAQSGPDISLVAALTKALDIPVLAEGRVHTPAQARQAIHAGAWAVVVGTAITAPGWITRQFILELSCPDDSSATCDPERVDSDYDGFGPRSRLPADSGDLR